MAEIIIQGISFDAKSSFQIGPGDAPAVIREVLYDGSMNLYSENGMNIDNDRISDKGDFRIDDYFDIEKVTEKHLEESERILTLGGDHSITFPIIKAFSEKYPGLTFYILMPTQTSIMNMRAIPTPMLVRLPASWKRAWRFDCCRLVYERSIRTNWHRHKNLGWKYMK